MKACVVLLLASPVVNGFIFGLKNKVRRDLLKPSFTGEAERVNFFLVREINMINHCVVWQSNFYFSLSTAQDARRKNWQLSIPMARFFNDSHHVLPSISAPEALPTDPLPLAIAISPRMAMNFRGAPARTRPSSP